MLSERCSHKPQGASVPCSARKMLHMHLQYPGGSCSRLDQAVSCSRVSSSLVQASGVQIPYARGNACQAQKRGSMQVALCRVCNTMCLTPRHGNLSQGCISVPIPILRNPICLNPVFETPERSSTAYGITQIIPQVVILH